MITDEGKAHIKRFIAGQVPTVVRTIALGIGNDAALGTDQRLNFEVERVPVSLQAYDPVLDKVIYKAQIPDTYIGKVYEIGVYSLDSDTLNDSKSQLITSFEDGEGWTAGTWNSTNTRVGLDSLRLSATSGNTTLSELEVALDLSQYSPTDSVLLAYQASANSQVKIIFQTDSSNYFTGTATTVIGYNVSPVNKSAFVSTGTPSWNNITKVILSVTGSGGTATVDLDAVSFVDQDHNNPDMVLVARQVLTTPFSKIDSTVNEIEFRMNVVVS